MAQRIIDAVHDGKNRFLKHLLVDDCNGHFQILDQLSGQVPEPATAVMNEEVALHQWENILTTAFFTITGHHLDSRKMAAKRIGGLH